MISSKVFCSSSETSLISFLFCEADSSSLPSIVFTVLLETASSVNLRLLGDNRPPTKPPILAEAVNAIGSISLPFDNS